MDRNNYIGKLQQLLNKADVRFDGDRPWDIKVHNNALFGRILGYGSLGLGESYMEGWWDCEQLDELFSRLLNAELAKEVITWQDKWFFIRAYLTNRQLIDRSKEVAEQHYDAGNDLYRAMLDKNLIYTCGYWRDAHNLDQAQEHKLELVCRKLKLQPGMRVLDIGCGWGGAARYMAENHHVEVVGVTISEEQLKFAQTENQIDGVEFRLQDYREVNEPFDRIYSLGMFEHVGFKNYATFFDTVNRNLVDGGLFLLHTIGHRTTSYQVDPWIERYVFPNSILPSAELISKHSAPELITEDWHNFGLDYHRTLMSWTDNINQAWPNLPNYDETFRRMWRYYLGCCAGTFKARRNHLWQIVFSKGAQSQAYDAVRSAV